MIEYMQMCLVDGFNAGFVNVIGHQANCFNTMNSGVARVIRVAYPEAYEADCYTVKGDKGKLGTTSLCTVALPNGEYGVIFNLYGQYNYGKDGKQYTEYDALDRAFAEMVDNLDRCHDYLEDIVVGFPKLGCGLAGGDWEIVEALIKKHFVNYPVIIFSL